MCWKGSCCMPSTARLRSAQLRSNASDSSRSFTSLILTPPPVIASKKSRQNLPANVERGSREAMSTTSAKTALTILQWTLGLVILTEAILFVLPSAAHDFARTHMPGFIRMILGWGEIAGCVLLLIPKTTIRGAWFLVAIFTFAILIHLLHGAYNVGNLLIYTAAALAIAIAK